MNYDDVQKMQELDLIQGLIEARRRDARGVEKNLQAYYPMPRYKPGDPLTRGIVRGAAQILGMPVDIATAFHNLGAAGNQPGMNYVHEPIGGSDWMIRKLGVEAEPETSSLPVKLLSNVGEFGSNFLTGYGLSKLPGLAKSRLTQQVLGGESAAQMAKMGVASGAGYTLGEDVGGSLGGLTGAIAAPMSVGTLGKLSKLPQLANQTGAVSMSPSALSDAWQNTVGSKLMKLGHQIGEVPLMPRQSRPAKWLGGNNLNSWLMSPLERMDQNAAQVFRDVRSEAERTGEALRQSAKLMQNLSLDEREALRGVIRSNFDISKGGSHQAKISQILDPLAEANSTTHAKLYTTQARQNRVEQELDKRLLQLFAEDSSNPLWTVRKTQAADRHDFSTPEGTMNFLDEVLKDPTAMPEVKAMARDLYDLPAKTAVEVADAHRRSYEVLLNSTIKNNPNWAVSKTDLNYQLLQAQPNGIVDPAAMAKLKPLLDKVSKGELVEIPGNSNFKDLLVDRHIAEGIRDLEAHVSNFRKGWNKYFLNPWKFSKIGLNIPARFRDIFSNFMFNDISGKNPLSPMRLDVYGSALNDIRKAGKGAKIPELEQFFYHTGGKLDALNSIATDPIFDAMRHDANPIDSILGMLYGNRVSQFSSNLIRNADLWAKYAKFKHNLASGKFSDEEAIVDALRATGNMLEQPRAVRNIRDTAMPFFGWTAHALKTIASGMAQHPVRTMKWYLAPIAGAQYALNELDMSNEEYEDFKNTLPEYMQHEVMGVPTRIPMPYRDEKGRIQMMDIGWWIPGLQDLSEMDQDVQNPIRFMQNPAFTLGASLLTNKRFSGSPIYQEWDTPATKWSKGLGYTLQQLLPPMTPGVGNQATKIWEAFKDEDPDALTLGQALGTQVGYRVTPTTEGDAAWRHAQRLKTFENEARHQMKKELGKTQDPEKQQKVIDYYQTVLDNLE